MNKIASFAKRRPCLAYSLYGTGFSAFFALGVACLLMWFLCIGLRSTNDYPYLYPFSIIVGLFSLIACMVLLTFAVISAVDNSQKLKPLVIMPSIFVFCTIPMFVGWVKLIEWVGELF